MGRLKWNTLGGLAAALLLPLLWLAFIRIVSLHEGADTSSDAYYHVAMADMFPGGCVASTFPYTTLSLWHEKFYDKELGFHMLLAAVRGYGELIGLSPGPPFHLPGLFFPLILIASVVIICRMESVPAPWIFSMLLVAACPFFTQRLLMLRPHVLAITIMVWFCWSLVRLKSTRQLWLTFLFGAAMAYSYSNPHFLLGPAILYAMLRYRKNRALALLTPLATLAGILAALTLHPQFPNTFLLWKIQGFDVVRQTLVGDAPVYVGVELTRPKAGWFFQNVAVYLLTALNAAGCYALLRRTKTKKLSFETRFFWVLQCAAVFGTFFSKRMLEYAWPFAILASALLFRDLIAARAFEVWPSRLRRRLAWGLQAAALAALLVLGKYDIDWIAPYQTRQLGDFANWARKNLPAGTLIANPNWSDFPMLFYSAPEFRYLLGIEPMFAYHKDPKRVAELEAFRTGRKILTPGQLRRLTGARYAFVSRAAYELARDMSADGFFFVYQNPAEGWLFDLENESLLEHRKP